MKINYIIIFLSLAGSYLCYAPVMQKMPKMGTPEFDSMIVEQMNELEKELSSKSPQEQENFIKMLAELGEEITKEAESKGYENPFDYIEQELVSKFEEQDNQAQEQPAQPEVVQAPVVDNKAQRSLAELLKVLAAHVASLREKTVSSVLSAKVELIKYRLDDLVYYLELFQSDNLLEHTAGAEHKEFVEKLQNLEIKVAPLSADLTIIPFNLEGQNHYAILDIAALSTPEQITEAYHHAMALSSPDRIRSSMAQQGASVEQIKEKTQAAHQRTEQVQASYRAIVQNLKAENIVDQLVEVFIQATNPHGIIDGFKALLEKYEPVLAQQRASVQQAQEAARKAQERAINERPAFRILNATAFDHAAWRPYSFDKSSQSMQPISTMPVSQSLLTPSKPSESVAQSSDKATPYKNIQKENKDQDVTPKSKPEVTKDLKRRVGATESVLSALKTTLQTYAQDIKDCSAYLVSKDDTKNESYQKIFSMIAEQLNMIPVGFKRALNEFRNNPQKTSYYKQAIHNEWNALKESQDYQNFARLIEDYQKMVSQKTLFTNKNNVVALLEDALKALDQVQALFAQTPKHEDNKPLNTLKPADNYQEPKEQDKQDQQHELKEQDGQQQPEPQSELLEFKEQDSEPNSEVFQKKQDNYPSTDVKWNEFINIQNMTDQQIKQKYNLPDHNDPDFEQKKNDILHQLRKQMQDQ